MRALRKAKGWTLKELSKRCGLSVSFLSQVERGQSTLSIVSLYTICDALGVPASELLSVPKPVSTVLKDGEQPIIRLPNADITYRWLSGDFPGRVIEVLIGEFPPNYRHPLAAHEGEEFGYVLEGKLILQIGEKRYHLEPGDSFHFPASLPHGYTTEAEGARVLWALTQKFIRGLPEFRVGNQVKEVEIVQT